MNNISKVLKGTGFALAIIVIGILAAHSVPFSKIYDRTGQLGMVLIVSIAAFLVLIGHLVEIDK